MIAVLSHDHRIRELESAASDPGAEPCWFQSPGRQLTLRAQRTGIVPLYYRRLGETVHLAVQPADLAIIPPRAELDLETISRFARLDFDLVHSPFVGVHGLPGGCELTLTSDTRAPTPHRWWLLPPEPSPHSPSPPATEIWEAIVSECAREMATAARVAVMLSGGVDSAAIAAATIEAGRRFGQPAPLLLSAEYPGLLCDERGYQEAVAEYLGAPRRSVNASEIPLWPAAEQGYRERATPLVDGQEGINRALYRIAREEGCDLIFWGLGGDELFQGKGLEVDLLRSGRWLSALRLLNSIAASREYFPPRIWWGRGIRQAIARKPLNVEPAERRSAGSWTRAVMRAILADDFTGWRYGMVDRTSRAESVRLAFPYFGDSVLQVVAQVPSLGLMAGDRFKGLLREALQGHLPEIVVNRVGKANFQAYYQRRLELEREQLAARYRTHRLELRTQLGLPDEVSPLFSDAYDGVSFLRGWFALGALECVEGWSHAT